jgi:hypothetical protein
MGLHREVASANLSVLEAEVRRRVWWQILTLEGQTSSLSGHTSLHTGLNIATFSQVLRPGGLLNVNDSDLSPNMREPPREHEGITEMLFCCIRQQIGRSMWAQFVGTKAETDSIETKIKNIDELEARLQEQYIQYCDPSVALHCLATLVVRTATAKMRLRVYAPHRYKESEPQPQEEKDAAFALCLQIIEYDNRGHNPTTMSLLKGFMWHMQVFFQLEAFIYILSELRVRTIGEQADWAWEQVEACYGNHQEILKVTRNNLWFAVGNLALKAWEERIKARRALQGGMQLPTPDFVRELCAQRGVDIPPGTRGSGQGVGIPPQEFSNNMPVDMQMSQDYRGNNTWVDGMNRDTVMPSSYIPIDGTIGSMDWQYWQALFDESGMPLFT